MKKSLLLRIFLAMLLPAYTMAGTVDYRALIDDYDTPPPGQGWYYHAMGGDRGDLNEEDMAYTWDNNTTYKAQVTHNAGLWTWGGMWYSLIRINRDNIPLDFKQILGPYIKARGRSTPYPAEVIGLELTLKDVQSTADNHNLVMRVELKDANDQVLSTKTWEDLLSYSYPHTFTWNFTEAEKGKVKLILWIMDRAYTGDAIVMDRLALKVRVPDASVTSTADEAFLWNLAWLLYNYNPQTGMVGDRSNFGEGDDENVTATGKLAKLVAIAYRKDYMTYTQAKIIITKIADTLLYKMPRGPAGVNTLWPHFTQNGGTQPTHNSEWPSGDGLYTGLDLIAALQMLGGAQGQLPDAENYLRSIDYSKLTLPDGALSHGYTSDSQPIASGWRGMGMETVGVNWAKASATGTLAIMLPPPSDNGSGFIDNAHYPMVLAGIDHWGNNWVLYRRTQAEAQINWYHGNAHRNNYLWGAGLFGLSAGERPGASPNDNDTYAAYGIGGKTAPEDGGHSVVVPHYPAMIADIKPDEALRMWRVLRGEERSGAASFLGDRILISPLNNVESMSVNPVTGKTVVHYFKGSWNLALAAEGWAMADEETRRVLTAAVMENAFLNRGYRLLVPPNVADAGWVQYQ